MKYSLADYIVSITPDDAALRSIFGTISIGGEGSATDSIEFAYASEQFTTEGFATGGWVHSKSLDKHGTVTLTISQLSPQIEKFKQMVNIFFGGDYEGFTFSLSTNDGIKVATGIDCYPQKIPNQVFGRTAATQQWGFTAGKIDIN